MEAVLTKSGLEAYHDRLKKYIDAQILQARDSILEFSSSLQFPSIGKEETIYIDIEHNKTYRWDDGNLKYYCIGSDYNDIELIACGDSTSE
nr:MAG TPA: hypothetical protein [Caudoviricetes sp.]